MPSRQRPLRRHALPLANQPQGHVPPEGFATASDAPAIGTQYEPLDVLAVRARSARTRWLRLRQRIGKRGAAGKRERDDDDQFDWHGVIAAKIAVVLLMPSPLCERESAPSGEAGGPTRRVLYASAIKRKHDLCCDADAGMRMQLRQNQTTSSPTVCGWGQRLVVHFGLPLVHCSSRLYAVE
jgi:hypothetical protein